LTVLDTDQRTDPVPHPRTVHHHELSETINAATPSSELPTSIMTSGIIPVEKVR
jgi:hypothetical protein